MKHLVILLIKFIKRIRKNDLRGQWKQEGLERNENAVKEETESNSTAVNTFSVPSRTFR
jgi:hypothetical protein